eukprot:CAMPEP_0202463366 /NCGR_PEP_ID=MMETSP1360-20130828/57889_1 /ASSEMBLY_ACC=CAM_ASM_000848 /TAXON_ID=515479 /ORGANISM="Licmophora paradoxa, Strain CCMP2313" /LENGTH=44 /DNA_ID= /DNA_START= /DNA_END= /DNA_ORIENTATION=
MDLDMDIRVVDADMDKGETTPLIERDALELLRRNEPWPMEGIFG